jgi:probable HAF family extracellular repeat protein
LRHPCERFCLAGWPLLGIAVTFAEVHRKEFPMIVLFRCLIGLALASSTLVHAQTPYRVIDLGPAGYTSFAVGINEAGQVAGHFYGATGGSLFLWDPVSGRDDIAQWNGNTTFATGLNDDARIVGTVYASQTRAFLHSPSTGYRVYGTLTGMGSGEGMGVNNAGQIVGSSVTASGQVHAVVDTPGVGMVDLGTLPGGDHSIANAINNNGWITGNSTADGGPPRPFLYTSAGGMVQLSDAQGSGRAINDRGDVAGWLIEQGRFRSFVHRPGEGLDVFSSEGDSMAIGLNNRGAVVGSDFINIDAGESRAFYYSPQTGMVNLNDALDPASGAGWVIEAANDINDMGWIVGHGEINGETHAVLLKPVPEPETWALMFAGLGVLAYMKRSRRRLASARVASS